MHVDLKKYIPKQVISGKNSNRYPTLITKKRQQYLISYQRPVSNHTRRTVGTRKHQELLPKRIETNQQFFLVMGLLQGEMSKTNTSKINYANAEPGLINPVMKWFSEAMHSRYASWHWYLRLNIDEPRREVHEELQHHLIEHWMKACPLDYEMRYKKTVSYVKNGKGIPNNEGTLMIEQNGPIFAQTMMRLVKQTTKSMFHEKEEHIIAYLQGIIAAESCINFHPSSGHFRVFISAKDDGERAIFKDCLVRLGINCYDCVKIGTLVISRKENIKRMHEIGLVTLSLSKHHRFLEMINSYTTF